MYSKVNHENCHRQVPFPKKTSKPATGRNTSGGYVGYIRQVVLDKKVCKIVTNMYILSFINPKVHCAAYGAQSELGTLKVEIIHVVKG